MSRTLISADDIPSSGSLMVPQGAIVTALARDLARERGVELVYGAQAPSPRPAVQDADLAERVRAVVTAMLASAGTPSAPAEKQRQVKQVSLRDTTLEPFPFPGPKPGHEVRAIDVVTSGDGSPMAAGYMSLTAGVFPWEFTYDEVQIVLEGELHLGTPDGVRVGRPGDIMFVPKGSSITFGTPSWAKFVYVTFPANWAD